jgi:hypothetical protein
LENKVKTKKSVVVDEKNFNLKLILHRNCFIHTYYIQAISQETNNINPILILISCKLNSKNNLFDSETTYDTLPPHFKKQY